MSYDRAHQNLEPTSEQPLSGRYTELSFQSISPSAFHGTLPGRQLFVNVSSPVRHHLHSGTCS